jgi:hypothetical protein
MTESQTSFIAISLTDLVPFDATLAGRSTLITSHTPYAVKSAFSLFVAEPCLEAVAL